MGKTMEAQTIRTNSQLPASQPPLLCQSQCLCQSHPHAPAHRWTQCRLQKDHDPQQQLPETRMTTSRRWLYPLRQSRNPTRQRLHMHWHHMKKHLFSMKRKVMRTMVNTKERMEPTTQAWLGSMETKGRSRTQVIC